MNLTLSNLTGVTLDGQGAGKVFTGRISNNVIVGAPAVPGGFKPAGIVVRGGQDILIDGNRVSGVPYGIFLDAAKDSSARRRDWCRAGMSLEERHYE